MAGVKQFNLRPDRSLINSDFQNYKLCLDPLPTYKLSINGSILKAKLKDDLYSYQQSRIFALHNHIHYDNWHEDYFYYITNDKKVHQVKFTEDFTFSEAGIVFEIPLNTLSTSSLGNYDVTINFPSLHHAIVADGSGIIYLLETAERSTNRQWKILFRHFETDNNHPFIAVNSIEVYVDELQVHSLLLWVDINSTDSKKPFVTKLDWITLSKRGEEWYLSRKRTILGLGCLEYAALDATGKGICIAADTVFNFISDSLKPVKNKLEEKKKTIENLHLYAWTQTAETLTAYFLFSKEIQESDIDLKIHRSHFSLKLKDIAIVDEPLFLNIICEKTKWTFNNSRLQIMLEKEQAGMVWQEMVKGVDCVKEITDVDVPDVYNNLIVIKLNLTNDRKPGGSVFNSEELEECDDFPSDSFFLVRLDGESHENTHQVNLSSHQWLLTKTCDPNQMPPFCVRHDVDGLLWQPIVSCEQSNVDFTCTHLTTFNALGYVQASKEQRKYSSCSTCYSFSVICDIRRHVYVYFQPTELESTLKNRKTGQKISTIAKQQLINLDSSDEIIGFAVSKRNIFIMTTTSLYAIKALQ